MQPAGTCSGKSTGSPRTKGHDPMTQPRDLDLSPAAWAQRERLIESFEDSWRRGQRPDIDAYLPPDAGASSLLPDLVQADLEFRTQGREHIRVEAYFTRYP